MRAKLYGKKSNSVEIMSAEQLLAISETLSGQLDDLSWTTPTHVYNPLDYAWENHATYVRRYGQEPGRILMVGMNPGPWGMAQTGLPFGDVEKVSQWMGISGSLGANLPNNTQITRLWAWRATVVKVVGSVCGVGLRSVLEQQIIFSGRLLSGTIVPF